MKSSSQWARPIVILAVFVTAGCSTATSGPAPEAAPGPEPATAVDPAPATAPAPDAVPATAPRPTPASAGRTVQPGAPGEATRAFDVAAMADSARPGYTAADVRFMQGMIAHHLQALEMTSLVPTRTNREDIALLARRIAISQDTEIELMQRWLRLHGEEVPAAGAHEQHMAAGHHVLMPGMATPEQMAQLAAASGTAFDRLFLQLMIRHHQGALGMVAELFATRGAGQESQIFQFAAEVDADQRIEIARMADLLARL